MVKPIVILPAAEADLEQITDYILLKFGVLAVEHFISRFEKVCEIISSNPELYSVVNTKRNVRKCVLAKQSILYFRICQDQIEILKVFDTRQNPQKNGDL